MAQVNNTNNRPISHNWSYKPVGKKDIDRVSWPFKIIRDEGKQSKMECRSLTDLEKSFEGTPYNFSSCPQVKSRYSLVFERFKKDYEAITPKITHLLLTLDSVYFLVSGETEPHGFTYATKILDTDDKKGLLAGYMLKSKFLRNNIKNRFDAYKASQNPDEYLVNELKKEVINYYTIRKQIRVLDNTKLIIDVLKSELNFTSLQYLVFIGNPAEALDYQKVILDALLYYGINPSSTAELEKELKKIPTIKAEKIGIVSFVDSLKKGDFYRTIRKVYYYDNSSDLDSKAVKSLFMSMTKSDYTKGLKYISDAENTRIKNEKYNAEQKALKEQEDEIKRQQAIGKEIKEAKEEKEKENREKAEIVSEISYVSSQIFGIIQNIEHMLSSFESIAALTKENNMTEYNIWGKYFEINTIKNYIDLEFKYNRAFNDNAAKEYAVNNDISLLHIVGSSLQYTVKRVCQELNANEEIVKQTMQTMGKSIWAVNKILPVGLSDERHTPEKMGIDTETLEGLKKLNELIKVAYRYYVLVYRIMCAFVYGLFGRFMARFGSGVSSLGLATILVPKLTEKYRIGSKNFGYSGSVIQVANRVFNASVNSITELPESKEAYNTEYGDFVKAYLDAISGKNATIINIEQQIILKPEDKIKGIDEKYCREKSYLDCLYKENILDIIEQALTSVHIDVGGQIMETLNQLQANYSGRLVQSNEVMAYQKFEEIAIPTKIDMAENFTSPGEMFQGDGRDLKSQEDDYYGYK